MRRCYDEIIEYCNKLAYKGKLEPKRSKGSDEKVGRALAHWPQMGQHQIDSVSTVYGSGEGCYFIDAHKSLMNVAVFRAKDHFFVFGDLGCLSTGVSTASGLLREIVVREIRFDVWV